MDLKGLNQKEQQELIPDNCIFLGYRGSIAHGMYVPSSDPTSIDDKDIVGVYFASPSHYIGVKEQKDTYEKWYKEWDCIYYELKKLIHLLIKGNPNVLSLLWLDERFYLKTSDVWKQVVAIRKAFTCKNVYHSFVGYAHGQIHRMTHQKFEGYMGEKRKSLVEKFGWDCKKGAHCIRLLRMGIEFLTEGKLYVLRTSDATQLLEIKRGEWSLEQVTAEADRLFRLCEEAYIHSSLPVDPDFETIDSTIQRVILSYIEEAKEQQKRKNLNF